MTNNTTKCLTCNKELNEKEAEICEDCRKDVKNAKGIFKITKVETEESIGYECQKLNGKCRTRDEKQIRDILTDYYALKEIAEENNLTKVAKRIIKVINRKREKAIERCGSSEVRLSKISDYAKYFYAKPKNKY